MGRFSTTSTISDSNTKLIDAGLKLNSNGTIQAAKTERVEAVTGSCQGVDSSQFHVFMQSRKRETERWNRIEQRFIIIITITINIFIIINIIITIIH